MSGRAWADSDQEQPKVSRYLWPGTGRLCSGRVVVEYPATFSDGALTRKAGLAHGSPGLTWMTISAGTGSGAHLLISGSKVRSPCAPTNTNQCVRPRSSADHEIGGTIWGTALGGQPWPLVGHTVSGQRASCRAWGSIARRSPRGEPTGNV